jgi:hypothetical protein
MWPWIWVWTGIFSELNFPLLMIDSGYGDRDKIDKLFSNFGISGDTDVLVLVFEKSV